METSFFSEYTGSCELLIYTLYPSANGTASKWSVMPPSTVSICRLSGVDKVNVCS